MLFPRKPLLQQGKILNERITQRRSFSSQQWKNPSIHGTSGRGWAYFLAHEYLFFGQNNNDGWQYIFEDSIKFSLRLSVQYCY